VAKGVLRKLVTLLGLLLSSCASPNPAVRLPQSWDGRLHTRIAPERVVLALSSTEKAREAERAAQESQLAKLERNSPEWWTVRRAIDKLEEQRLAKIMFICRGC